MKEVFNVFKGRRVFITGHTGFKGSWLAYMLHRVGADVTGFSLSASREKNNFSLLALDKKVNHIIGDVRDFSHLNESLTKFQPEFVFHLAAQALVRTSYSDPVDTFSTNIQGSINLLESVRQSNSVRSLVYITSDKCYENVEWIWGYRENDPLGGRDPYSASKAAAEIVFSSYEKSFFNSNPKIGVASARAGNVIGGGDWALDRIIPDCVRAIESDTTIFLRNPFSTRPWQHVLEPLSGYLTLAFNLYHNPKKYSGAWNFGPSTQEIKTVKDVADIMVKHIGKGRVEILNSANNIHEANLLQLNCDKAHQLLNWYPRWTVGETLDATAIWYKSVLNGGDAEEITISQLNAYFRSFI
ncbi:CDP-glucose 4,6-dehydratase [Candidatus Methylopumilus rimovensis]|nr:CDP-glucose 4,6-dehydratase [Candidatus Methylopumilus rimovensis]